jgi:U3 small nucleolar RNA-associated protein MPP10
MNDDNHGPLDRLLDILEHPERRILPLLTKTDEDQDDNKQSDDSDGRKKTLQELLDISKSLFQEIETLGGQYLQLDTKRSEEDFENSTTMGALSGLPELYLSPDMPAHDQDLPETVYGQLDLQNTALLKLVRKSTKKLGKATNEIRVLDISLMDDGSISDGNGSDDDGADSSQEENEAENSSDQDEEDDEARRMRERMERAMDDMEDEDEEKSSQGDKASTKKEEEEDRPYDPIAEDMKDGFFDLNEMEDFADEEEEYLPEEAFGQPEENEQRKKKKPTKSFHQRQRDGEMDDGSEDDGDDFDDLYEDVKEVKRKQYREQEDIDALHSLYTDQHTDDSDAADAANMTAADFFGQPRKDYIARYKRNHPPSKAEHGDDDDSWGDYDFEKSDQGGWGDDKVSEDKPRRNAYEEELDVDDHQQNDDDDALAKGKGDTKKLTKHEDRLRQQTEELEKEMLAEKPWQMTGESKGTSRPVNSLLEATPEFEMASKQAPTITVEHTVNLEEVIKKRVLAEDWDDVAPRELPDIGWNKKRGEAPEVSQEKSKLGLGELYEREYLKKAVGYDKDADEKKSEEDKAKDEMKQLFANLCSKLDALSNYHFAPRPIADEAEVRPVTAPAIAMEEVLPLHVSDARGVAPEEVYAPKRGREGVLRSESEMDQNDRKRLRQSKKAARRKARKEKQADEKLISRLQPGLGLDNPYEKRKARQELEMARSRGRVVAGEQDMDAKFGASGTFFKRLQAEAQQTIQASTDESIRPEKKVKAKSSAFKL